MEKRVSEEFQGVLHGKSKEGKSWRGRKRGAEKGEPTGYSWKKKNRDGAILEKIEITVRRRKKCRGISLGYSGKKTLRRRKKKHRARTASPATSQ